MIGAKESAPKVTIIIAAYNCSHTLKCAIASVLGQTFTDFEAWIVGDCCTDDSEQVVASFGDSRLHWTNLPARSGSQFGPNNEGLRRARGQYIAYLGQDDLWFPWHLESLVLTMEQTGVHFVHAMLADFKLGLPTEICGAPQSRRNYGQRFVAPSCWMHRREVYETCGPWPQADGQIAGVDFVYQRRIFLAGFDFASTRRLSVIKFHSSTYRIYAKPEGYPQPEYLARMQRDPIALLDEVTTRLMIDAAQEREASDYLPTARFLVRGVYRRMVDWYGVDRWPLSRFLLFRYRRFRRRIIPLRGLAPMQRK